jgi:hypothetical protein
MNLIKQQNWLLSANVKTLPPAHTASNTALPLMILRLYIPHTAGRALL